jgi:hypothetical protein
MKRLNVSSNGSVHVSSNGTSFCPLQGAAVTPLNVTGIWFKSCILLERKTFRTAIWAQKQGTGFLYRTICYSRAVFGVTANLKEI